MIRDGIVVLAMALALVQALPGQETFSASADLDAVVETAVREGVVPGAVVVVGHDGKIVHRKAYGYRALVPAKEPMTVDTIFDIASLTKVIATTPSIMKLFERGKVRIDDPVTAYLPEFQNGKSDITVRDLLTHFSGLRPDLDLKPAWSGYQTGIGKALIDRPMGPPGVRFVYSDINFELLGEIVRRVSGKPLDEFAREEVFVPLGMKETGFHPAAELRARIAPTEIDPATGLPFRGVVHDPTARYMGGVAGHAGVFSTASDLAKYAAMLAEGGAGFFSPLTVRLFTTPASPPDQHVLRGLGWDIDSGYSAPRGELFGPGSYGHTGFTGTSLWIDPASKTFVIVMANSVHPNGNRKSLSPLRSKVATIVAKVYGVPRNARASAASYDTLESAGVRRIRAPNHEVLTGLDVMEGERFSALQGKRVGLITNQTGVDRAGRRNVDAMLAAGVTITALFSPEHGINGKQDQSDIADAKDPATGIPVWSLYQNARYRRPPAAAKVDLLVFDIQDAGARFYTYSCTLLNALEDASKTKTPFYVLDRPNPITGDHVEGPVLDADLRSFVGCYALPVRHGMTLGELAEMANSEQHWGADLHVVKMQNWQRGDWFDSTGLTWIDPSPNLRSLNAALLYDGLALLEASPDYSVGRGTDAPFEQIGANWIRGSELAEFLNQWVLPGVRVYATRFQPASGPFSGKTIEGVRFVIINREQVNSVRAGLDVAYALQKLYPGKINFDACRFLIGGRELLAQLKAGVSPGVIEEDLQDGLRKFEERRQPFLLY